LGKVVTKVVTVGNLATLDRNSNSFDFSGREWVGEPVADSPRSSQRPAVLTFGLHDPALLAGFCNG
jgi:hypothetical protein